MPIEVVKITREPKARHTHGLPDSRFASVVALNGAVRWLRGVPGVAIAPYRGRTHATASPEFKARVPSDDRRRTRDCSFAVGIATIPNATT